MNGIYRFLYFLCLPEELMNRKAWVAWIVPPATRCAGWHIHNMKTLPVWEMVASQPAHHTTPGLVWLISCYKQLIVSSQQWLVNTPIWQLWRCCRCRWSWEGAGLRLQENHCGHPVVNLYRNQICFQYSCIHRHQWTYHQTWSNAREMFSGKVFGYNKSKEIVHKNINKRGTLKLILIMLLKLSLLLSCYFF